MRPPLLSGSPRWQIALGLLAHKPEYLVMGWNIAAQAIEELHGTSTIERQAHIFEQLAIAHLYNDEDACAPCRTLKLLCWKWIQRDRPQQAYVEDIGAGLGGDRFEDAAHDAVANEHYLRAFKVPLFRARLAFFSQFVFSFQCALVLLKRICAH